MKANTVVLTINEYNELRDFKKRIEDGKICGIKYGGFGLSSGEYFYTENKAIAKFEDKNNELEIKIKDLESTVKRLEIMDKINPREIDKLKKMSYWEFRKWKKS